MVRACQEHGVIFMAGHVMNFFRGVRYAKELINDGAIRINMCNCGGTLKVGGKGGDRDSRCLHEIQV